MKCDTCGWEFHRDCRDCLKRAEDDESRQRLLERLKAQGYTEEDLEASNPYNQWMKDHP